MRDIALFTVHYHAVAKLNIAVLLNVFNLINRAINQALAVLAFTALGDADFVASR